MTGLFVTGTDTGVGKTVITAALALGLRARGVHVRVVKPLQSGARADDPEGDAMLLRRWAGLAEAPEEIAPFAFAAPLAPLVAARLEGRRLELAEVAAAVPDGSVLVEGAGGLHVPGGEDWTVADLAAALGLPLLVVARPGLGTVNHTLLTVEAACSRGLAVAGVVLNGDDPQRSANARLIESFGGVPVIGQTPWLRAPIVPERLLGLAEEHMDLDLVVSFLIKEEANV